MPKPSMREADADLPRRRPRAAAMDAAAAAPSQAASAQPCCNEPTGAAPREQLQETLRLASEGDQRAWRTLIETYSGRVFGLIRAQCSSSDLAEEITQSTFCTVVAKIGSYTELGKFEQWLFRIAMNRLRDEMRRRKRQARPVEDESLTALAEGAGAAALNEAARGSPRLPGPSVLAQAGGPELRALRIAMTQLSDSDQHIIHLRHNAGLSFKQIAEVLEQPLGTVLARQHRALKKLGDLLRESLGRDHPLLGEQSGSARRARTAEDRSHE